MATHRLCILIVVLIILFPHRVFSYEKTLRKIVRNQSKMVQRPFSDTGRQNWQWNNQSHPAHEQITDSIFAPGFTQTKVLHRVHRPKMSTIIASMQQGRAKSAHSKLYTAITANDMAYNDLRLARNTLHDIDPALPPISANEYYINLQEPNKTPATNVAIETYYQIPTPSKFFPPIKNVEPRSLEEKGEERIIFPENGGGRQDNDNQQLKSIFMANKNISTGMDSPQNPKLPTVEVSDDETSKVDFFLHGTPVDADVTYSYYNVSKEPYICEAIKETPADIDAQKKFSAFDIEPPWVGRKHFWNRIFDSRYESLLRNTRWPSLKVILMPRTHVDTIWKKPFEHTYNDSVSKILANIIKKMQFYSNLTFTWNEVSHLSRWWKRTTVRSRLAFRRLLNSGRLEITTGAWVESDEATTHIFGLIHQLVEGHEWLKNHLNYFPKTAWLTNTVTHSDTMTYLLSTLDIYQLVVTNLHFSWEQYLAEYQYSDFIWLQHWDVDDSGSTFLNQALGNLGSDRYPKHSVITHYLQFNSDGFSACGPNSALCSVDFNFAKRLKNLDITSDNIKEKSELLLEQYSKSGTITPHNTIIAPLGAPYSYESQLEFDFQYNNYQKIANFVNDNRGIYKATFEFGTPTDYFNTIYTKYKRYPKLKGDFLNFADINIGTPAYWVGFFTSRPYLKILLRRLESTMRSTEILVSFAVSFHSFREHNVTHIFEMLLKCRETFARLMDRNVVSGTLPANMLQYAHKTIIKTIKECWHIQEAAASFLTSKSGLDKSYLQKYVYRDGEFISTFKTVSPDDHLYIFNSLSHEKTDIIELVTKNPNIRIVDYNKKEVTLQINPIWKYKNENIVKISKTYFKIAFAVVIPPMTLELFKIKATYDATLSAATIFCSSCAMEDVSSSDSTFPFHIQPLKTGDIQLENYKHRLIFDEMTGFLKTIVEKETNIAKSVVIDFGAFRDTDVNSGMLLFNTNVSKPIDDILMPYRIGSQSKVIVIISGQITTEISTIFGQFLQHTIRIFNLLHSPLSNAVYIETKVDYEVSPKNREMELFMSIQTEIVNGNPPQIYIDINGFQHTARVLNISRRIESNLYPITSMAYIQDHRSRFTYITDHAQGVTALQEGQLVVILDRRVLFNDRRGVDEGLADSVATSHKQFILLENFRNYVGTGPSFTSYDLSLPSLSAIHLANSLNNIQDIFIAHRNLTDLCHYGFLPLIKTSFPCDISVINFRLVLAGNWHQHPIQSTALLILHKRSFSCTVDSTLSQCKGETEFCLDKVVRNLKAVYQTNLAGTNKGIPLRNFCLVNFPPMELTTLRSYF